MSALTLLRAEDTYQSRDKWSYVLLAEELRRVCAEPRQSTSEHPKPASGPGVHEGTTTFSYESVVRYFGSLRELFRRMCFNALISNVDDHPRNHAVLARAAERSLSPAYDLTPAVPVSLERRDLAMECGDAGRYANAENLLSQSARFLLDAAEARALVGAMEAQVRRSWYALARAAGVSARDCDKIAPAFAYPGFREGGEQRR